MAPGATGLPGPRPAKSALDLFPTLLGDTDSCSSVGCRWSPTSHDPGKRRFREVLEVSVQGYRRNCIRVALPGAKMINVFFVRPSVAAAGSRVRPFAQRPLTPPWPTTTDRRGLVYSCQLRSRGRATSHTTNPTSTRRNTPMASNPTKPMAIPDATHHGQLLLRLFGISGMAQVSRMHAAKPTNW